MPARCREQTRDAGEKHTTAVGAGAPCLAHAERAVSVCMERTLHGQGAASPAAIPGPYILLDTHDPKLPFAQDVDKVAAGWL